MRRFKGWWLRTVSQTVAWRYSVAPVAFLISFVVRDLLNNWLIGISDRGLIIFLPAILFVTFFLGSGPAILTLLLSALAAWSFFLPPYNSFVDRAIVLATFVFGSGVGVALVHWLRIAITAAKTLDKAQTKYLNMLDGGFDAIILRDAQDRITSWNRGAERLYGWRRKEVLGRDIHSLFQTKFPVTLDEIIADMRQNGHWEGELNYTRKDGAGIVVFSRWTAEWDAKNEQLVTVLQTNMDITERKLADALIAADLRDMTLLNQLSNRLAREGSDFDKNLNAIVDTAITITSANKGNLQLLDPTTGFLTIAAERGFEDPFLNFFASIRDDASACAAAMRSGERVIVEDVRESEIFAEQPSNEVLLHAGVRAATFTPLTASTGNLLGIISIYFVEPHRPTE